MSEIKGPPLKPLFLSKAGTCGQPAPRTPRSALDAVLEGIYLPKKAVYLSGRLEDLLPADLPPRAKGGRPTTNPFWEMPLFGKGLIIAPAVWGMLPVPGLGSAPPPERKQFILAAPLCCVTHVYRPRGDDKPARVGSPRSCRPLSSGTAQPPVPATEGALIHAGASRSAAKLTELPCSVSARCFGARALGNSCSTVPAPHVTPGSGAPRGLGSHPPWDADRTQPREPLPPPPAHAVLTPDLRSPTVQRCRRRAITSGFMSWCWASSRLG